MHALGRAGGWDRKGADRILGVRDRDLGFELDKGRREVMKGALLFLERQQSATSQYQIMAER